MTCEYPNPGSEEKGQKPDPNSKAAFTNSEVPFAQQVPKHQSVQDRVRVRAASDVRDVWCVMCWWDLHNVRCAVCCAAWRTDSAALRCDVCGMAVW